MGSVRNLGESMTWGSRAGAWALCGRRTAAGSLPWSFRMQAWSVASPCGREHVWGKESGGGKAGEDVQAGQTSYGDASSFCHSKQLGHSEPDQRGGSFAPVRPG